VKGIIILNGNIRLEIDFIREFASFILDSKNWNSFLCDFRRVLLITSALQKDKPKEKAVLFIKSTAEACPIFHWTDKTFFVRSTVEGLA